jgi:hypothetical protein
MLINGMPKIPYLHDKVWQTFLTVYGYSTVTYCAIKIAMAHYVIM